MFRFMIKKTIKRVLKYALAIRPYQLITLGFAGMILLGTILLSLPVASRSGEALPFMDALFTATSATCVTGLIVVDINSFFSLFGQIVILILIQVGGLGIMTVATLFSFMLRRTITMKERLLMVQAYGENEISGVVRLTKHVLVGTLAFEAVGALVLSTQLVGEYGFVQGVYKAIFLSVATFCHCGLDLFGVGGISVSMHEYVGNFIVNFTMIALIVISSLGFVVWEDIYRRGRHQKLTLYSKLVLIMTAILLVGGAMFYFIFEYNNPATIGNMPPGTKVLASFFQSASTRTAGYESVSQAALTDPSKLLTILLMITGGSAGSPSGGIKTVTVAVLLLAVTAVVRGRNEIHVLGRRIGQAAVLRAVSVFFIAFGAVLAGTFIISYSQGFHVFDSLFEITSALGTVGLSVGITPVLDNFGKMIFVLAMFAGRIGFLTFTVALTLRQGTRPNAYQYPQERIII